MVVNSNNSTANALRASLWETMRRNMIGWLFGFSVFPARTHTCLHVTHTNTHTRPNQRHGQCKREPAFSRRRIDRMDGGCGSGDAGSIRVSVVWSQEEKWLHRNGLELVILCTHAAVVKNPHRTHCVCEGERKKECLGAQLSPLPPAPTQPPPPPQVRASSRVLFRLTEV